MKRFLLISTIVLTLGGLGYGAMADTGPSAPPPPGLPGHPPGPWAGGWGKPPGFGPRFGANGWKRHHADPFGLFAHVENKHLSVADVKIIATAILLQHGNHDWTVTGVAAQSDKAIDFSFATPHGDVVAAFAIDPATGRITRID